VRAIALALLVVLLAGCGGSSSKPGTSTSATTEPPQPVTIAYDEAGCSETVGIVLVSPATAQKALPSGVVPADASALLGLPASSGMAALFVNAVSCPDGGEASQGIYIQTPKVVGLGEALPLASLSFYQVAYSIGDAAKLAALQTFGMPATALAIDHAPLVTPLGSTGTVTVRMDNATAHAFTFVASGSRANAGLARFYTATPKGIVAMDYQVDTTIQVGVLTQCTIGGRLALATGVTSCQGRSTAALRFPSQAWTGAIHLLPQAAFG
jgi:hypothetical protein